VTQRIKQWMGEKQMLILSHTKMKEREKISSPAGPTLSKVLDLRGETKPGGIAETRHSRFLTQWEKGRNERANGRGK